MRIVSPDKDISRFPLCWPEGWPRTEASRIQHSKFGKGYLKPGHSMEEAVNFLTHEVELLHGKHGVISTNVALRMDGRPYSNQGQPTDRGAAVYFTLKERRVALACDKWLRVEDNVWAIAKHIEALRGQNRWGVGTLEQAFRGYMALPGVGESSGISWWTVLGVPVNATETQVREAYRILAKKHHPDAGGDRELWERINTAIQMFDQQLRNGQAPS